MIDPLYESARRDVLAFADDYVTSLGEFDSPPDDMTPQFLKIIDRAIPPVQRQALEGVHRWRNRQLAIALSVLAVVTIAALGTLNADLLALLYTVLFAEWIWLTVIIWRSWSKKDRIFRATATSRQELLELGLARVERLCTERLDAIARDILAMRVARGTPPPPPQPFGVSHEGAEALVALWMQHLGAVDAAVTPFSGDGGIDVESKDYIAQVKNYSGTVGVAEIRELAGVALVDGRKPLFFTSGTYAQGAVEFADRASIPLFVYDAVEGTLVAGNSLGQDRLIEGLEPPVADNSNVIE